MAKSLIRSLPQLLQSYILILFIALFVGLVFADVVKPVSSYGAYLLAAIFFMSALKIDFKEAWKCIKDYRMLAVTNIVMLLVFPAVVYYLTLLILPQYAIAFMILAAMPCGMTCPLLAEVTGGRQDLALVLTISTSLLAPFTIPLVIHLLAGSAVAVSFMTMFLSLVKTVILPIALANVVKLVWNKKISAASYRFKPISLLLLGLLIMGIVSKQADMIIDGLRGAFLVSLIALFVLFILFHVAGYFMIYWRDRRDRITISVCLTYMNFTLAIFLVGEFFTDPNIVVPIILSTIPWSLMVIPYKYYVKRMGWVKVK